jgi:hypothetical protein
MKVVTALQVAERLAFSGFTNRQPSDTPSNVPRTRLHKIPQGMSDLMGSSSTTYLHVLLNHNIIAAIMECNYCLLRVVPVDDATTANFRAYPSSHEAGALDPERRVE